MLFLGQEGKIKDLKSSLVRPESGVSGWKLPEKLSFRSVQSHCHPCHIIL